MIRLLVAALALLGSAKQAPAPAEPRWALRIAAAQCVLERQSPNRVSNVSIETTPGSDSYRFAIASATLRNGEALGPATLTFAPSNQVIEGYAQTAQAPDGTPIVWMQGIAPLLLDALSAAESVTLATRNGPQAAVAIPGARPAVAAFRECSAEQLIEWGADPVQFEAGGAPPIARKRRDDWIQDHAVLAIARHSNRREINDLFRVGVSKEGRVDDCRPLTDGVEADVEKIACAAVRNKPLFKPARDAGGNPVRGVASFRIIVSREPA